VAEREEHHRAAAEDPGEQRRRPRERRRVQRAEEPAGADDRADGREDEPDGSDLAAKLVRAVFAGCYERLSQLGRASTSVGEIACSGTDRAISLADRPRGVEC
jgi:hypothetical protein